MSHHDAAFKAGYDDCRRSMQSGSTSLSETGFNPPQEFREAYEAGWQQASRELSERLGKRERRGDLLLTFIFGAVLFFGGFGVSLLSARSGSVIIVAYGAIITGAGLLIKGVASVVRGTPIDT